jgi:ZIP family zinc transporter
VENILYSIAGILIPFIGTSAGSGMVFFMRKNMSEIFKKMIVGFAAGVMIAASVWSLILPSVEMAEEQGKIVWLPAAVGLALGVIFLIFINKVAEQIEERKDRKKLNMLIFSVTLHNIPEGMAVRSVFCRIFSWK